MLNFSRPSLPPALATLLTALILGLFCASPMGCISPSDFPAVDKDSGDVPPADDTDTAGDTADLPQPDGDQELSEVAEISEVVEVSEVAEISEVDEVSCPDLNACGGCAVLPHVLGDPCAVEGCPGAEGTWQCDGTEAVSCSIVCCPAPVSPCVGCESGTTEVCNLDGQWETRTCTPECQVGDTREFSRPCGYCGTQFATFACSESCQWLEPDNWKPCEQEGPHWLEITGPQDAHNTKINHVGTNGSALYAVLGNNTLYRYTWGPDEEASQGDWEALSPPPLVITAMNSFGGLAYHDGHLYATAIVSSPHEPRTLVRYDIASDKWEEWLNPNVEAHFTASFSNALIMDPERPGVGYAAHHAGFQWLSFDWARGQSTTNWLKTDNLVGAPTGWTSRNESVTRSPAGIYYATRNVSGQELQPGDMVYHFSVTTTGAATPAAALIQKPWKAGLGQSLAWIEGSMTPSCQNELWLIRGLDATTDPQHGTGAPTQDWARYPLGATGLGWQAHTLPGLVDERGAVHRVRDAVFVRGNDNSWYVAPLCPCPTP